MTEQTKTPKTIVFFNSNKAWGGGEKWHFTTAKEFEKRGYNTIIATNANSEIYKRSLHEKVKCYSFQVGNLSFLNPIKLLTLALFFKSKKVDAVILNLPADLKFAGIAAKIARVPKIIYRRGMPHPLRNTFLNRFLFTKILTNVIVNSEEIGRSLAKGNEEWFPKEKMVLIYNGVDTTVPVAKDRKFYQKQGDEIVIGNAGRLTEQKGQKYLIEMAKILKDEGMKFKLLIAGEGELKEELSKQIIEAGVHEEVQLVGHIYDMTAFLNSLDVFVFSSLYEGSANTLIETLWHEIPTVAFNVSSNPEIVVDKVTGWLTSRESAAGLAKAVKEVVGSDQGQVKENGVNLVVNRFDSVKNLAILSELLKV